jgi:hypothetical protein
MRETTVRQGERLIVNWYQSDQFTWRATLLDYGGYPHDLTGKTVTLYAKINPYDTSAAFSVVGALVDADAGIVSFAITSTHTANVRDFTAELEVTSGSDAETFIVFSLRVLRDIG